MIHLINMAYLIIGIPLLAIALYVLVSKINWKMVLVEIKLLLLSCGGWLLLICLLLYCGLIGIKNGCYSLAEWIAKP